MSDRDDNATAGASAQFPARRMRRLRRTAALRELVAETHINTSDLIMPLFVREDITEPQPISSLPGMLQHTQESLRAEVKELASLGLQAVMLFGLPAEKDEQGSQAWAADGVVQVALRNLREDNGDDLALLADLCLDEYTSHGHCGLLKPASGGAGGRGGSASASGPGAVEIDNDATLELYQQVALAQAQAGAHMVAPSGMMDGQVGAIRQALDGGGYENIAIMAYSAKYASAHYGPFREAVNVSIAGGGDRKSYQQDPANVREALSEIALDVSEGADIIMVKPALSYLDVIAQARARFDLPLAAYHVSGEYAMLKAAAANGWIDGTATALEHLTAIKRAGADIILTYLAREFAELGT